jgi:hypothetical protein
MNITEATTTLPPAEVIERARVYFAGIRSPNTPTVQDGGESWLRLHLDMGEVVIAALPEPDGEGTRVRGSASRGVALVARFLTTLPVRGEAAVPQVALERAA